ncbi:MAG: maleylacetoacetate isomerase, partial [Myxococcota bacterium]
DDVYPDPPILPEDPVMRARCRQLAEIVNSGIQPLQNLAFLLYLRDEFGADRAVHSRLWIAKGLDAYAATLPEHDGAYSVPGARPSVADFCLIPQLYNSRRFSLDLNSYPRLLEIEEACAAHPWFIAAHPDRMPDAQEV